jgi:hypothetical protein
VFGVLACQLSQPLFGLFLVLRFAEYQLIDDGVAKLVLFINEAAAMLEPKMKVMGLNPILCTSFTPKESTVLVVISTKGNTIDSSESVTFESYYFMYIQYAAMSGPSYLENVTDRSPSVEGTNDNMQKYTTDYTDDSSDLNFPQFSRGILSEKFIFKIMFIPMLKNL